ncbi:MAG: IS1634 family transposase [Acidimicrobiia bacterium]|nr:IS1634 family transposase [Acidimicrobiia bacterium]
MFVKTTRRRRGDKVYEYLSLVETVRKGSKIGHRTLLRLGEVTALRETGQLGRIISALERHLHKQRVDVDGIVAEGAPAVGAVAAAAAVWKQLGLGGFFADVGKRRGADVLEHAVFAMVANRLVAPCSKRRLPEWTEYDVVMPQGWSAPSLDQYYRALDAVADVKEETEEHLYRQLCNLTNLNLRLVCYDLTSTYFEGSTQKSEAFPSRVFGYSRDHRSDRPQIVIGLLCTTDGIPIAHHMFAGNTNDASTLPGVLDDLAKRFAVGRICVVSDRGLISASNLETVTQAGFDHLMATRLHRDRITAQTLSAIDQNTVWVEIPEHGCRAADVTLSDGTRTVVVESDARARRDTQRTTELIAAAETKLLALEHRVRSGRLKDPAKIGRAAQRILGVGRVGRLFDLEIGPGRFLYHYNEEAQEYEKVLAGRYVLTTSLTPAQADTAEVVACYRQLQTVENKFRVLKDFLRLRPVRHWTEKRVRGHVAVCVYAALMETLITQALTAADIRDPDLEHQHLTAARALQQLHRVRRVELTTNNHQITLTTRRTPLQTRILAAVGVDTRTWDKATIT